MFHLGVPELLIILVIVIVLFGVGRISGVAGEIGKSIRLFRENLRGEEKKEVKKEESVPKPPAS